MALRGALGSGLGARDATFVSRGRRGTILHPPSFRVAGVALMALRGALGSGLGARDAAAFCVASVAQPYIHLRFTWQAWHNLTSTFVSRGRRGTHGTPWRAWVWFGRAWRRSILRGRRGTTLHPPSFHVAGVAQSYIHLCFAWQAWHSWHSVPRLGLVWARPYIHTYIRTYVTYIHTYLPFYLLDLSPPPLSFLPSLSPLKPLKLIIGRSWLVGLSGPLIFVTPWQSSRPTILWTQRTRYIFTSEATYMCDENKGSMQLNISGYLQQKQTLFRNLP